MGPRLPEPGLSWPALQVVPHSHPFGGQETAPVTVLRLRTHLVLWSPPSRWLPLFCHQRCGLLVQATGAWAAVRGCVDREFPNKSITRLLVSRFCPFQFKKKNLLMTSEYWFTDNMFLMSVSLLVTSLVNGYSGQQAEEFCSR